MDCDADIGLRNFSLTYFFLISIKDVHVGCQILQDRCCCPPGYQTPYILILCGVGNHTTLKLNISVHLRQNWKIELVVHMRLIHEKKRPKIHPIVPLNIE
jgi:hypothetical protein